MVWNPFSSPTSKLPLVDVLELANKHLENARKEKDPAKALQLSRNAKSMMKDAEKIFANTRAMDPTLDDGIANTYHEHGKLLDEMGYHDKAQRSHTKAEKWGYIHVISQNIGSSPPGKVSESLGQSLCPPVALSATPSIAATMSHGILNSSIGQSTSRNHTLDVVPIKTKNLAPTTTENVAQIPKKIFDRNITPPITKYVLPEPGGRITSTSQLAYCLSLLHPLLATKNGVDEAEHDWSRVTVNDPDENSRLKAMATDLIRVFIRDELKKPDVVAEIVSLAAVLDQDDFRKLLGAFVDGIEQSVLLEVHLLDGLVQLIRNVEQGYSDADDLVKILRLLNTRLLGTHMQSTRHTYQLSLTISHVLDSMVDSQVQGLSREDLHEPLSEYLKQLQDSSDSSLVYQAAYAFQALQYVPDDETVLQSMLRRTGKVIQGVSGLMSALKALDLNGFIQGLQSIQGDLTGTGKAVVLVNNAYLNSKSLAENGQGFLDSLKEGFSFTCKSAWYPALRGLDKLLQDGRFADFEKLVREAPCQHDPAFQWGVSQRLGEIALNTAWDDNIRKCAISFLGEMYKDDATWGQQDNVKQWILRILNQVANPANGTIAVHTQTLMQELETNGSTEKQALYQACKKIHSEPYPIVVTLPPKDSLLLDFVQDKPDVDTPLRQLRRERLKDRGGDVYISPRAKPSPRATDEFDLTSKVQEFLESDRKVLLLLGDSGAGKSTFNRALEISLWDKYDKMQGRIPLFIHLPAIEEPEHDMIVKHLRGAYFTEVQIRELKMHREFIVICDGYDESQQTRNLYMSNQLNQPGQWRAQMVISCRTEYTGVDYKDCFQPTDRHGYGKLEQFQEVIITPFNKDQIQNYVDQYVLLRKPSWESKDYQQAFKRIPNLQDLVRNPFLLKLALEVLPRLLKTSSKFTAARITRVGLYDEFIAQWIERGMKRLTEIDLGNRDREALRMLSNFGFKHHSITYFKDLVTAIYDNQGGNPLVSYAQYRDRRTWKEEFFNERNGKNLLREAIPLARNGDQFRFIHRSVLEYGLALAVFDPSSDESDKDSISTISHRGSISSVHSFEITVPTGKTTAVSIEQSLLDSPLGKRNFVGQGSILVFLTERAQQHPAFKAQLLAVIERSKTDKGSRIGAANAITILVKAGVQFNGADLRGIRIPGADLSFGVFDSAHLEGADLRKANLQSIWIRQANLSGSQVAGVQFGELPYLAEKKAVMCCAYSPNGNLFATGLMGGDVSLYETDWQRIGVLGGHSGDVRHLKFSPTSDQIATGSDDMTVRLWDVNTGKCLHILQGHTEKITGLMYSPKGDQIASASQDSTVRLWSLESGDCIHTLTGQLYGITSIAYSPKGHQIASGAYDGTVRLWDIVSGDCVQLLKGHTSSVDHHSSVGCVVYSPEGDQIASGSHDTTIRLWNVDTGDCIRTLGGHSRAILTLMYSPKGDRIASASEDNTARLWNVDTGECVHILEGHSDWILSVVFSPKGDRIATGSEDCSVRLWDVDTGECINTFQGHRFYVSSVAFSPKGNQIASGGLDSVVRLWSLDTSHTIHTMPGHSASVRSVNISPKGDQIASGSEDHTVRLWNVDSGDCIHILQGHIHNVNSVIYSPEGGQVASGSYDCTVRMWDVDTGDYVHILEGHMDSIGSIVYSPKGDRIASRSFDDTLRLWDVDTGSCIHIFKGHSNIITSLIYSPKGGQVASGSGDQTVRLWDVDTGDCVHILQGHSNAVFTVAYSPNGDQIASGSHDWTVRLWDVDAGTCIHILQGHSQNISKVVFSLNGDQIASGSHDQTVRLWDVGTGDCIHTLQGHSGDVTCVTYSPTGDQIATGGWDYTVRLWDVDTGQCLATIWDFNGDVNSIMWKVGFDSQYLITGSSDKSVRQWQFIKEEDDYKAVLCWSSSHEVLMVSDASFDGVQGLCEENRMLLRQRGASAALMPVPV